MPPDFCEAESPIGVYAAKSSDAAGFRLVVPVRMHIPSFVSDIIADINQGTIPDRSNEFFEVGAQALDRAAGDVDEWIERLSEQLSRMND
jgi:hypothetical protein